MWAAMGAGPVVAYQPPDDYVVLPAAPGGPELDATAVGDRLRSAWSDPALGRLKGFAVDAVPGDSALDYGRSANLPLIPASTTKLLTAVTILTALAPDARFRTTVRQRGDTVYLVGGGDPQLVSTPTGPAADSDASLTRLARLTAQALPLGARVAVRYDASLFDPPYRQPYWKPDFLPIGVVAPASALAVDGGRLSPAGLARSPDPARAAAVRFAGLLREQGVEVVEGVASALAQGKRIAAVQSATLADLVEHMLLTSDNTEAEVLAHHAGRVLLDDPTFSGGARATLEVLGDLGVETAGISLWDGSGLSRANRISPAQLVAVLRAAVDDRTAALWPVLTGLPVAAFDGSLAFRFGQAQARAGRGAVTGKTGTLTGVSVLAGILQGRDGSLIAYAAQTNAVNSYPASAAIDDLVSGLAGCGCAGSATVGSAG